MVPPLVELTVKENWPVPVPPLRPAPRKFASELRQRGGNHPGGRLQSGDKIDGRNVADILQAQLHDHRLAGVTASNGGGRTTAPGTMRTSGGKSTVLTTMVLLAVLGSLGWPATVAWVTRTLELTPEQCRAGGCW